MHGGGVKSGGRKRARVEIVPLIDVMFFLLASFMLVSLSLQKAQTVKVQLPAAPHAVADFKPDVLNLGIDRAGTVHLGKRPLDPAGLDAALRQALANGGPNAPIFVTGDREARLGAVNAVLRRVRTAGFQKVAFITSGDAAAAIAPPPPTLPPPVAP